MKTSRLQILFACCLLLTGLCLRAFAQGPTGKLPPPRGQRNPPPPIRRPTPRPQTVSTIVASGELRPLKYVKVTAEATGRVREVRVTPGDEITKGQELLVIDSPTPLTQVAPLKGIVADIAVRVGDTVSRASSSTALMTIADMATVYADVLVDRTEGSKVAAGQQARIRVDAFSEKEIRGAVISKNSSPDSSRNDFVVRIELREIPSTIRNRLRPGMSATATIAVVISR